MFFIICKDGAQFHGDQLSWDQAKGRAEEHGGILSAGLRDDEDFRRELKGAAGYLYFRKAEQTVSHRLGPKGWQAIPAQPRVISETVAAFFPSAMLIPMNEAGMARMAEQIPLLEKRARELSAAINAGQVKGDSDEGNPLLVKIRDRAYRLKLEIERIRIETDLLAACPGKLFTATLAITEGRFLLSEPEKDVNGILGQNPEGWIGAAPKEIEP